MKKGDTWVSKTHSLRGFRVVDVRPDGSIDVEVDRVVVDKDGQPKIEQRKRSVDRNDLRFFTLGYEQES